MPNFHRILRKTKAVVSPGMKPGESRDEYRVRYLQWWAMNQSDLRTAINAESMDTVGEIAEANGTELKPLEGEATEVEIKGVSYREAFTPKPVEPKKLGATRDQ